MVGGDAKGSGGNRSRGGKPELDGLRWDTGGGKSALPEQTAKGRHRHGRYDGVRFQNHVPNNSATGSEGEGRQSNPGGGSETE